MAGSAQTLFDAAEALLAAAAALLEGTSGGTPERRFVSIDVPPLDCPDTLAVHATGPEQARVSAGPAAPLATGQVRYPVVYYATLMVTVTRCQPQPRDDGAEPPDPADLTAAARTSYEDAWTLYCGLAAAHGRGELDGPSWRTFEVGTAAAISPAGAAAGWIIPVTMTLDGFAPGG